MPRQEGMKSVLVLGAGPIVIGQACEFDYAGSQAIGALKARGCRTILVNPNPATIMTDRDLSCRTYIEPLLWPVIERIIALEKPDYLLPIMGGQTALNCAIDLYRHGVLDRHQVRIIGTSYEAIMMAEDRNLFRALMQKAGISVARSVSVENIQQAQAALHELHFPLMIRPSFTLGGDKGGMVFDEAAFMVQVQEALRASSGAPILIEESLLGFKEFEMEMLRDARDHCIVVCSIENLDAMGVHTGDSMAVTPVMTLTDKEYQQMRQDAFKAMRALGRGTVCANIQFAVCPVTGRRLVVEMNPRVSRSSALASKATGYPIAKVAAQLALGLLLHEIEDEATGGAISAFFEPTLDYVAVKLPRFDFAKFPHTPQTLSTTMRSVGEVLGLGDNFHAALQKAIRALELERAGLDAMYHQEDTATLEHALQQPTPERLFIIAELMRRGRSVEEMQQQTQIEGWFLEQIRLLVTLEEQLVTTGLGGLDKPMLAYFKAHGFSDRRLAFLLGTAPDVIRQKSQALGVLPCFRPLDPTAGEMPVHLNAFFSTYQHHSGLLPGDKPKVVVIGSGPNCIGQGIEFDYCCVRAMMAFAAQGYETVMINCNPETVSTDHGRAHRLYFEALTEEDVLAIIAFEKPVGVALQFGGRSALKLMKCLDAAGVKVLGTLPEAMDCAEDRVKFKGLVHQAGLLQPQSEAVWQLSEAITCARRIGYPVLIRPSYIIGGQRMAMVEDEAALRHYFENMASSWQHPVLIEAYLAHAIEVEVDAVSDGKSIYLAGMIEHFEPAGIHSGDSTCIWPPIRLDATMQARIKEQVVRLAEVMGIVGLMNVQFAVAEGELYLLEVNPRASRTLPFISKATGIDLIDIAVRCMLGVPLEAQGMSHWKVDEEIYAVKMPVFPFDKFSKGDRVLGPEMKATGEVMGVGKCPQEAYCKASMARSGRVEEEFIFEQHRSIIEKGFMPRPLAQDCKLGYTIGRYESEVTFCSNIPFMDRTSIICLQDLHMR